MALSYHISQRLLSQRESDKRATIGTTRDEGGGRTLSDVSCTGTEQHLAAADSVWERRAQGSALLPYAAESCTVSFVHGVRALP